MAAVWGEDVLKIGAGEPDVFSRMIKDVMAQERHAVYLLTGTQKSMHAFLSDPDKSGVESGADLPADPAAFLEVASEAWASEKKTPVPASMIARCRAWLGLKDTTDAAKGSSHPSKSKTASSSKPPVILLDEHEDETTIEGGLAGLVISEGDVEQAEADMKVQGLSGARLMALALSLHTGQLNPDGESAGILYGSNVQLCQTLKTMRKAGLTSLDDLLKAKDKSGLSLHFGRLSKEYAKKGRVIEATLISQWWAESVDHFDSDVEGLVNYIREYFRVFAGRGLPEPVCTSLVMRLRQTGGKGSTKEIEAELKKAKDKATAAEESVKSMKNRMKDLEDAVKKVKEGAGGKEKMKCFNCGGNHLARDCDKPDRREGEDQPSRPTTRGGPKGKGAKKDVTFEEEEE